MTLAAVRRAWRNLLTPPAASYPNGCRTCYDYECAIVDLDLDGRHRDAETLRETRWEHAQVAHPQLTGGWPPPDDRARVTIPAAASYMLAAVAGVWAGIAAGWMFAAGYVILPPWR